jgi:hypothetical protein
MNELYDYLILLTKTENCPIQSVHYIFQFGPFGENFMLITMKSGEEIKCDFYE